MELIVIRTLKNPFSLVGASIEDVDKIQKIPIGKPHMAKVWIPRNLQFHRKFMALINVLYEMQHHFNSDTAMRYWLTMKAGYFTMFVAPNGYTQYYAESISFTKMDEQKFEKLYNAVIDTAIKHICKGNNQDEIDFKVDEILGFC